MQLHAVSCNPGRKPQPVAVPQVDSEQSAGTPAALISLGRKPQPAHQTHSQQSAGTHAALTSLAKEAASSQMQPQLAIHDLSQLVAPSSLSLSYATIVVQAAALTGTFSAAAATLSTASGLPAKAQHVESPAALAVDVTAAA